MTTSARILEIEFRSYWHAGTGRSGGEDADAMVERDSDGLPYVPGRHLKGLLRDACVRLAQWGAVAADAPELLFGTDWTEERELKPAAEPDPRRTRHATRNGCLAIESAHLSAPLRRCLADPPDCVAPGTEQAIWRRGLFAFITATKIDADSGVAATDCLRRFEITVPLTLQAAVRWAPEGRLLGANDAESDRIEKAMATWPETLAELLPYVRALGADRSRGYGRACLTLKDFPS